MVWPMEAVICGLWPISSLLQHYQIHLEGESGLVEPSAWGAGHMLLFVWRCCSLQLSEHFLASQLNALFLSWQTKITLKYQCSQNETEPLQAKTNLQRKTYI